MKFCPFCGNDLSKISSEGKQVPQISSGEVVASVLDDYSGTNDTFNGIEVAKPEYLDNQRRLLRLRNRPIPIVKVQRMDEELDKFGDLIVGSGLIQED